LDQVSYVPITPLAVTLINPASSGGSFGFQFSSQAGFTHTVQYRTNLISGIGWQPYTNIAGDGSVKVLSVPLSVFNPAKQGFVRVYTH
jgi:hypothetical protein